MQSQKQSERLTWFKEARFGLFFHWGTYAVYGRGAHAFRLEYTSLDEYKKNSNSFKPKQGWADEWMQLVKHSGGKYAVLTTKHHEGYCLFETKSTDYSAPKTGPGRDLVMEFVAAARRAGIKIGFYFTPWDWRFGWQKILDSKNAKFEEYRKCMHTQIKELCTHYGPIDLWWWDGRPPDTRKVIRWMRKVQPNMIINDRCGLKLDCATSEKEIRRPAYSSPAWEVCMTSNKHWAYYADEKTCQWMSLADSIHWLVGIVSNGGNFLYNIGPKANGDIPTRARKLFEAIGDWLKNNGESIYDCGGSSITGGSCGATTARGNTTYLHVLHYIYPDVVILSPKVKVQSARILLTGKRLKVMQTGERVIITGLPKKPPDVNDTIILLKTGKSSEL